MIGRLFIIICVFSLVSSLCSCARVRHIDVEVMRARQINVAGGDGDLPINIRFYDLDDPRSLRQIDYFSFWDNSVSPNNYHHMHYLSDFNIAAHAIQHYMLSVNKHCRYLAVFAHFFAPEHKQWYAKVPLPKNLAWQGAYLSVRLQQKGLITSFHSYRWLR